MSLKGIVNGCGVYLNYFYYYLYYGTNEKREKTQIPPYLPRVDENVEIAKS